MEPDKWFVNSNLTTLSVKYFEVYEEVLSFYLPCLVRFLGAN